MTKVKELREIDCHPCLDDWIWLASLYGWLGLIGILVRMAEIMWQLYG